MSDHTLFEGASNSQNENSRLASWLQMVLQPSSPEENSAPTVDENDIQLALLTDGDYHLSFYQQLPDFVIALLTNDAQATVHYAPLLFHLVTCRECHRAYLDLYDALRAAVEPQGPRPALGQGTRTLSATPQRMLAHLCRSLISQSEAIWRQARHDHSNLDVAIRSLLQLSLQVSAHIMQSSVRQHALQDLVRVATLFEGSPTAAQGNADIHSFSPVFAGAGGSRRSRTVRRADVLAHPMGSEPAVINLQSNALEGYVVQVGSMLELHLQDLTASLRGHYVSISILLGSLIEPVRWLGGNPRAIRSGVPVDTAGSLVTLLGQTDLQLSNPEERNLLEAMFLLLELHKID